MKNYYRCKAIIIGLIILSIPNLNAQILLPVEVIGENFTTASRTFNISNSLQAEDLYLLVNNFNAEHKVQIKFNRETSWTSLTNSNTRSDTQGEAFGAIGGGYSTIKIYVNISGRLNNGTNTIQFRFNNVNDDISSGYRIVAFNILRGSGAPMIPDSDFEYEDPSTWTPIFTRSSDINLGEALWNSADIVDSDKNPQPINAKCASCHAADGRDLKYFNYSNLSIVERSKFHGLTQREGELIASYIRSLDVDVPENARPWNPPYQPGPGLDSKSASEWSAGAGLEWVLENDADMEAYLFPNGTSDDELNRVFNIKGTLNIREMPIALQFPDWNRWLPRTHPIDMMSREAYEEDLLTGVGGVSGTRRPGTYGYQIVKENLKKNSVESYRNESAGKSLPRILEELGHGVQDFLYKNQTQNSGNFPWTILNSPGIRERPDDMLVEEFKVNLAKWNAVKHWEIMQEFKIEGEKPSGLDYAEARQWPLNNWTVFAIAPHVVADRRIRSRLEGQAEEVGLYESTAWYQLQMTLNAGMRFPRNVAPVDWAYNFDHVTKSGITTGHKEPLRFIQNLIKAYQQRDNTIRANGNDLVNQTAWNMREVSPWRLYSTAEGNTSIHDELDTYETGLRAKLFSKLLKMFMDKADMLDESDWPRSADGEWHTIEERSYRPSNYSEADCLFPNANGRCADIQNAVEADAMFTLMPLFRDIGMNCGEVERLRAWSETMWPRGDWSQFEDDDCTALSIDDPTLSNYFTVYPSPSKGLLHLSFKDAWTLFDVTGKEIMAGESKQIDITHLPASMYFLNTSYGVKKIIKN